jgi:hypothetical protein
MNVKLLSAYAVMTTGQHEARLDLLRLRVERLAEFHDVEAALAQRGSDGRRRIRLARRHLKLDQADDFLCHCPSPIGCKRTTLLRRPPRQISRKRRPRLLNT